MDKVFSCVPIPQKRIITKEHRVRIAFLQCRKVILEVECPRMIESIKKDIREYKEVFLINSKMEQWRKSMRELTRITHELQLLEEWWNQ